MKYKKGIYLFLLPLLFLVSSCGNKKSNLYKQLSKDDPHHIKYTGTLKVGNRYKIKSKTYTPKKVNKYVEVGIASWYGSRFHNKKTANGERYNKNCLTAAHPTLPLPCLVKVENLSNHKSIILLVNDRGPYSSNRIIDISERGAKILGFLAKGTTKVKVQYLPTETKEFLEDIGLTPSAKKPKIANNKDIEKCSINGRVKLINMKYRYPFEL